MSTNDNVHAPDLEFRVYDAASFGRAIRSYRRKAGLTQAQLANRVGLHRSYLARMEQGNAQETLDRLVRVLAGLGVTVTLQQAEER